MTTPKLPENLIFLPGVSREQELSRRAADAPRPTVRVRPWAKQRKLPLEPGTPSMEQRINAAKGASANYREQALAAEREADACRAVLGKEGQRESARRRQGKYTGFADTWDKRVLELIAERDRATAQQNLLPGECGNPHSQPEQAQ